AANSFLDALAHHRRARGLPALSINWGPWASVGQAAAQANRGERLALRGMASITPALGLRLFMRLLQGAPAQMGVMRFDLRQWREFSPAAADAPLLSRLMRELRDPQGQPATGHFRETLLAAETGQRRALLEEHLREQIGQVVRLAPAQIDRHTP